MAAKIPLNQLSEDGRFIDPRADDSSAEEIVLHEDGNPWAVANMLTGVMREKFNEIPAQYFGMHERHLEALARPSELDEQLRLSFWDEYFVCIDAKKMIDTKRIFGRLCTKDYFYKTVVYVPAKYAYMLQPPSQYTYRMRGLLNLGHKRLRQILEMPLKDGKNVPNIKLISEIVKIVTMLENRVHGSVVQKIDVKQQTKSLNVNVNQSQNQTIMDKDANEIEKIQREIEAIEKAQAALPAGTSAADIIDVGVNDDIREAVTVKTKTK